MIDFSKKLVKFKCPVCNRSISTTLKQIANKALIKCNCRQNIRLEDANGTNKKFIKDANESLKNLEKSLKNFGK